MCWPIEWVHKIKPDGNGLPKCFTVGSHLLCLQQDCFSDPTLLKAPTAYTPPAAQLWGLWHEEQLASGPVQVATAPSAVGTAENGVEILPLTAFSTRCGYQWPGPTCFEATRSWHDSESSNLKKLVVPWVIYNFLPVHEESGQLRTDSSLTKCCQVDTD